MKRYATSNADELFCDALELPEAERKAFILRACGSDPGLKESVEALLQAHAEAQDFLQSPPAVREDSHTSVMIDKSVGRFKIIRHIGSGGMGDVFEAHRADDQFEQQVAIKLIKPGLCNEELLKRFKNERQMLAQLRHANIAGLLDGGVTEDGRPYLVMEYVDGQPLTEYCQSNKIDIEGRLRLFVQVIDAVMAAHRQLVVHRDLKPGNILVQTSDRDCQIKLLDFGIAKVVTNDAETTTDATLRHQLQLMSPAYASPEQIRGEIVSTATDIYSLGVVLYELLCDKRPYRIDSRSLSRIQQTDFNPRPVPPSHSTSNQANQLRGDLDCIVMKALQVDPEKRYGTADEFRADIERHLAIEPVLAVPSTFSYRIRKLVMRHRVASIASAVSILALVIAVIASSWGWKVASQSMQVAQSEAETARAMNAFLVNVFAAPDPWSEHEYAGKRDVSIIDVLDQAVRKLDEEQAERPLVKAELQLAIGATFRNLGYFDRSEPLLRAAHVTYQNMLGESNEKTVNVSGELARLCSAIGKEQEAKELYDHRYSYYFNLHGPNHNSTLLAFRDVVATSAALGNVREAANKYEWLLKQQRTRLGDVHHATLKTIHSLGVLYSEMDELGKAEPLLLEALEKRTELLGESHPSTVSSMIVLAQVYRQIGRIDEAEPLLRKAFQVHRHALGELHPSTLSSKSSLAMLCYSKGELVRAIAMFEELVEQNRKVHGDNHDATISTTANLATLHMQVGDHERALKMMERAVESSQARVGEDHPDTLHCLHTLGMILIKLEDFNRADEVLARTVELRKRTLGPDNPLTLSSANNHAHVKGKLGRWHEAKAIHKWVLESRKEKLSRSHRDTLNSVIGYGRALIETKQLQEAKALYESWLPDAEIKESEGDWIAAHFRANYGECLLELGEPKRAESQIRRAHQGFQDSLGKEHDRTQHVIELLNKTQDRMRKSE